MGKKHEKENICQDYADKDDNFSENSLAIAIVADGHGSPENFRSDKGSEQAVKSALSAIKEFVADLNFSAENVAAAEIHDKLHSLVNNIIASWKEAVEADEKNSPLKEDEKIQALADKYKDRYHNIYQDPENPKTHHIHQAYGTTLLAVAATEYYWFGLHIGDGKCEVLFEDGQWAQPIPWDKRCFLNATTSMCDNDAQSGFRYWFGYKNLNGEVLEFTYGPDSGFIDTERKSGTRPVAIFIGSDGVDDTYPVYKNEKYLKQLYRVVVINFAKDDFDRSCEHIKGLSEHFAQKGSQDDVSIAGIVLDKFDGELIDILSKQHEIDKANEKAIAAQKNAEAKGRAHQAELARLEKLKKQEVEFENKDQSTKQEFDQSINEQIITQQDKAIIAEAELKNAEDEAKQLEEQCHTLESKSQTAS